MDLPGEFPMFSHDFTVFGAAAGAMKGLQKHCSYHSSNRREPSLVATSKPLLPALPSEMG
ncbi:hypothetical protein SAMN05444359_10582 [Neolewinella agarilytica]|uniref:Uncharacterized protein n=1 Tax=Neolewinella agarilytica TaxID=478744 RepID=A0A1H9CZQ1_9BACT|nr:hypothetical protein SAMN05444359_10582 [Neolewinella agarilytica]